MLPVMAAATWATWAGSQTVPIPLHARPHSLTLTLPPLSVSLFRNSG